MDFSGIKYKGDISKYIEAEDNPFDSISLYKDIEYFQDEVYYSKFVKHCETRIRASKEYSMFVSYIRNILGIDFCQV